MGVLWDPDFCSRSPMFEPLRPVANRLRSSNWPELDELNRLATGEAIVTANGQPIRFVPQQKRRGSERYEQRIYLRGEVQTRLENWHDLLNALTWLTFPRAKAALNERHFLALTESERKEEKNRGPIADTLTLFDEGGIVVVSCSDRLLGLLKSFEWKSLFWTRRDEMLAQMKFFVFGHALFEKALQPFIGVTGRAVLFEVEAQWLWLPLEAQLSDLDAMLATYLGNRRRLLATRELAPVPVLGVPGWARENATPDYYENTRYFRAGRTSA
jgi:hypothetical protein